MWSLYRFFFWSESLFAYRLFQWFKDPVAVTRDKVWQLWLMWKTLKIERGRQWYSGVEHFIL